MTMVLVKYNRFIVSILICQLRFGNDSHFVSSEYFVYAEYFFFQFVTFIVFKLRLFPTVHYSCIDSRHFFGLLAATIFHLEPCDGLLV